VLLSGHIEEVETKITLKRTAMEDVKINIHVFCINMQNCRGFLKKCCYQPPEDGKIITSKSVGAI